MTFHCTKLHMYTFNGLWVVSTEQNANFNVQLQAIFVFLVFRKSGLLERRSSFEELSAYKVS
jgi:hypothetical protein